MKLSTVGFIAIAFIVITVAIAGCATTQTSVKSGDFGQVTTTGGTGAAGSGSGPGSAGDGPVFGAVNYDWVEYRMTMAGQGSQKMYIYYKFNKKTGKCTMRFEAPENVKNMPTEMDCTSTGSGSSDSSNDPNTVESDVKFIKVGTESVTVPAGTFIADKYTSTYQGKTVGTYWFVSDKPFLKMESITDGGTVTMELNDWG